MTSPARYWLALKRNLRDYGLTVTMRKFGAYFIKPIYENRTYRIYCIELSDIETSQTTDYGRKLQFDFRLIHPEDTDAIEQIEAMAEWMSKSVSSKVKDNCLCVAAFDGSRIAGFNIVALKTAQIPLLNLTRPLSTDEAWSEQIMVAKPYRSMGLGYAIRRVVFGILKDRGIRRFCGGTLPSNLPSLRLANKAGFREIEDIKYVKIFGHKNWFHTEVK